MKPREYYERLISDMPAGAERVVLRVLSFHIGLNCAIKKPAFTAECGKMGIHFSDERQLRMTIVSLRKAGIPVCSSSGESGYFLASSLEEYEEFKGREYLKKIADMQETCRAMDAQITRIFPADVTRKILERGQPSLL